MLSPYWGLKFALKTETLTQGILSYVERAFLKGEKLGTSGGSIEISFLFFETTIKNLNVMLNNQYLTEKMSVSLRFSPQDLLKKEIKGRKVN